MSKSLFVVDDQSSEFWEKVISKAVSIRNCEFKPSEELKSKKVGLLFFEPSSRTRWSFEKACLDLGIPSMVSVVDGSTSLSKGEQNQDTLDLYLQLGFDLIVMRSGAEAKLKKMAVASKVSFISAGFGSDSHPTQALLDYFTWTVDLTADVKRILIMGDLKYSRVARSHIRMSKIFGYEVGLLASPGFELLEAEVGGAKVFTDRAEALSWAEVVMPLRAQKERHDGSSGSQKAFSPLEAKELRDDQAVMHPGPFMRGEDLEESLIKDKRSLIFKQKRNGVYCRAALLSCMLSE
ncbi:MAG: hypothetical protein ACRBBP_04000 [Bdellovibrionales bacterium]